jgi:hypothetical protein
MVPLAAAAAAAACAGLVTLKAHTSNLLGLIAMLSGGGIGSPSTEAVRQFRSGISSSAAAHQRQQHSTPVSATTPLLVYIVTSSSIKSTWVHMR